MDNANVYLMMAIAVSVLAAVIGILLNTWLATRRRIHREVEMAPYPAWKVEPPKEAEEEITAQLPEIPGQYGQLKIIEGGPHQVWILERSKSTIGRAPDVDIHLDSPMVSRRHAIIEQRDDKFCISDCGSTNGTIVNGIKISGVIELHEDDIIEIGQIKFLFFTVEIGRHK